MTSKRIADGDKEEPSKIYTVDAAESDSIFAFFPDDFIKQLSHICGHYLCWPGTQRNPILTSLKFTNCNAADENEGIPFSRAYCSVKPTNAKTQVFGSVFSKGIDILLAYFTERRVPDNQQQRHVLEKLLRYLLDTASQAPLLKLGNLSEEDLTLVLTNHLFGKLTASPKYVIDQNYSPKQRCPCGNDCNITGYYGDTSIGNEDVWHGNLDINLNQELGISNTEHQEHTTSRSEGAQSPTMEVKNSIHLSRNNQIIAETVVFSFLQRQCHPESCHFLVPSIGVSDSSFVICFYDSEHDILLESSRIPFLASDEEINLLAILTSWLVVNYKYLSSGLPESLKHTEKSGFFGQAKEKIEIYKNNLKFGNIGSPSHIPEKHNPATDTEFLCEARSKFLNIAFETGQQT